MSRPVFSFRPNLKNPEHEKAWRLLLEVPAGQRNQYLVDVILEKDERETLTEIDSGDCSGRTEKWRYGTNASM